MKRLFSILFASLILLSGMHLTVASHLCGGQLAAVKYSFSGELAGCGMEESQEQAPIQGTFHTNCCKNHVFSCTADKDYFASSLILKIAAGDPPPACNVVSYCTVPSPVLVSNWLYSGGPPVTRSVTEVDQSFICVLII